MTEQERQQRIQSKIEILKYLQQRYFMDEKGLTPYEKAHSAMHRLELQMKQEKLERSGR